MNEQSRKIWKTQEGASLLKAMFGQKPMDGKDTQTLAMLKQADPPTIKPSTPEHKRPEHKSK